ncbi:MAG: hypothetical protein PHH54_01815 [Candidatus Nanoarchaeia archaeon]|nr:hypothetical protein [Candidatus Nanoarchaeia archaeon]MDD5740699.1 hypothetical protein [Candidatus Nanoarchaeia archaeon]
MVNKKDFLKAMDKIERGSGLVDILHKSQHDPETFESNVEEYADFLVDAYEVDPNSLVALEVGSSRDRFERAQEIQYRKSKGVYKGLAGNLEELIDELGDNLQKIAFSVIPLKQNDLMKEASKLDLDEIKESYTEKAQKLKGKLANIDKDNNPERYEAVDSAIKAYEGYAKLINDNKDFVQKVVVYRELVSYSIPTKENQGKGNIGKMKELVDKKIDELKKKYTGKTDALVLDVAKNASSDVDGVKAYYHKLILEPAERELKNTALAKNESKMKQYIIDGVTAMDITKKANFLGGVYQMLQ